MDLEAYIKELKSQNEGLTKIILHKLVKELKSLS